MFSMLIQSEWRAGGKGSYAGQEAHHMDCRHWVIRSAYTLHANCISILPTFSPCPAQLKRQAGCVGSREQERKWEFFRSSSLDFLWCDISAAGTQPSCTMIAFSRGRHDIYIHGCMQFPRLRRRMLNVQSVNSSTCDYGKGERTCAFPEPDAEVK